jgi:hypothetical protein
MVPDVPSDICSDTSRTSSDVTGWPEAGVGSNPPKIAASPSTPAASNTAFMIVLPFRIGLRNHGSIFPGAQTERRGDANHFTLISACAATIPRRAHPRR